MHDTTSSTTDRRSHGFVAAGATRAGRIAALVALSAAAIAVTASPAFAAAPTKPTTFSVTAGPSAGNMTLSWGAPAANGGAAITSYAYEYQVDGLGGAWSAPTTIAGGASARSAVAACPAPASAGHGCAFQIQATNGTGGAFATSAVVLWAAPTTPLMRFPIAGPASSAATISWRAPISTGGLATNYTYDMFDGTTWSGPNAINMGSVTQTITSLGVVYSLSVGCTLAVGNTSGCSYRMHAVNAVGTSPVSSARLAPLALPGSVSSMSVTTTSVALGSGDASQTISWTPPTRSGGLVVDEYLVFACSTNLGGTSCGNNSSGWSNPIADFKTQPLPTSTTYQCPANGHCAYEVWTKNAARPNGRAWRLATTHPVGPVVLIATANTSAAAQLDLHWNQTADPGTAFGHYVLWECDTTNACATSGTWTNPASTPAPWTETDLVGTATSTTYHCTSFPTSCMFRVGYVDAAGRLGGVTQAVTAAGLDAPALTATSGAAPGSINLNWTPPATQPNATSYQLYRDTGGGYANLTSVPGAQLSYTDPTCGTGATCTYKVRAFYNVGSSADSAPASVSAADTPLAITTPAASAATSDTTPTLAGTAGSATGDATTVTVKIYAGVGTGGAVVQTLTPTRTGAAWTVDATALAAGTYTAQASQQNATLVTSTAITFTVDITAPVVALTTVNGTAHAFPYTTNSVTSVGGTCGTATGDASTVSIVLGGAANENGNASCNSGSWSYTLLTPLSVNGVDTATATQTDSAANTGTTGTQTITIDTTAPVVALTTVNGAAHAFPYTTNTTVTSVGGTCGTAPGDASTVSVVLGGNANENGTTACSAGTWSYTLLAPLSADGVDTATASQTDTATNTGTSNPQTITVDATAPAVTITTVNGAPQTFPYTTNTTVTSVGGACGTAPGDASTVAVVLGGNANENGTTACSAGTWSYTLLAPLSADGIDTATTTQTDSAANTGTTGTQTITIDTTAPAVTITSPIDSDITTTTPTLTGARGQATGDLVTVTVNIYAGTTATGTPVQTLTDTTAASSWSVTAASLPAGPYAVQAVQSDSAGNVGSSAAVSFTTA